MRLPGLKYYLFAAIATGTNLLIQFLCRMLGDSVLDQKIISRDDIIFFIALIAGTGISAVLKYILDKFFIFKFKTESLKKDIIAFFFYGLMALITTIIFWGIQTFAVYVIGIDWYIGGFIGLLIGYTVKYFLDSKFVFKKTRV